MCDWVVSPSQLGRSEFFRHSFARSEEEVSVPLGPLFFLTYHISHVPDVSPLPESVVVVNLVVSELAGLAAGKFPLREIEIVLKLPSSA